MKTLPSISFRQAYDHFNAPVTTIDCGQLCAPHNPSSKPFCCDICHAVPAVYRSEWAYLKRNTDLWHTWRAEECPEPSHDSDLQIDTPRHMRLLACKGPWHCQRDFRAMSCRQFPFFPYITADDRFIGLAYEWTFEETCWVISHVDQVSPQFRGEFVRTYDNIFGLWSHDYESYAVKSEQMRAHFVARRRRIPILHRNGRVYLLSPSSERMQLISADRLKRFGPYRLG
jgi:hypothetical protein